MTTANVLSVCAAAGMKVPCYSDDHSDSKCVMAHSSRNLFHQMKNVLCKELDNKDCQPLQNLFVYMKTDTNWGTGQRESCGFVGSYCHPGKDYSNKLALCVMV